MTGFQRQGLLKKKRSDTAVNICKPTIKDVIVAIESLYDDKIKPFGRILLRRTGEYATVAGEVPYIDPRRLRQICERCPQMSVEVHAGGEFSAALHGYPADFIDSNSPIDKYPAEFWEEAAAYFASLAGSDAMMPGGRYGCVRTLVARDLPFLQGRSLGEVCHIVALAVMPRKLLGYLDGHIVPYSFSESFTKDQFAAYRQPVSSTKLAGSFPPAATWEEARVYMLIILQAKGGSVPLPNVKRLFNAWFQLELSETFFGHSRLVELLKDEAFQDICRVERRQSGDYLVIQQQAIAYAASISCMGPYKAGAVLADNANPCGVIDLTIYPSSMPAQRAVGFLPETTVSNPRWALCGGPELVNCAVLSTSPVQSHNKKLDCALPAKVELDMRCYSFQEDSWPAKFEIDLTSFTEV